MATDEIIIKVRNEEKQEETKFKKPKLEESVSNSKLFKTIAYFGREQVIKVTQQATTDYLDVSGNDNLKKSLNDISQFANPALSITSGFAFGGVAGGTFAILGQGINAGLREIRGNINVKRQQQSIDYAYNATGNASLKGSRYSND